MATKNEENWLANYKALKSHILEYCYFHNKHDKRFIKSNLGKKGFGHQLLNIAPNSWLLLQYLHEKVEPYLCPGL